jgi:hypothetical protein
MKKFLCIVGLLIVSKFSLAQNYKSFRVIVGGGYAARSGYAAGGLLGTIEPGYRLSDKIALGLRGEIAGIARGGYEGFAVDVDISSVRSTTVNSIYYFDGDIVRPFVGVGLGRYSMSAFGYHVGASGPEEKQGRESKFGFYPRAGIELGHLGFTIDYNIISKTQLPNGAAFKNSYLSFRLSVFFGGGVKTVKGKW